LKTTIGEIDEDRLKVLQGHAFSLNGILLITGQKNLERKFFSTEERYTEALKNIEEIKERDADSDTELITDLVRYYLTTKKITLEKKIEDLKKDLINYNKVAKICAEKKAFFDLNGDRIREIFIEKKLKSVKL